MFLLVSLLLHKLTFYLYTLFLFTFRGEGVEKGKHQWVAFCTRPNQVLNPQPGRVP